MMQKYEVEIKELKLKSNKLLESQQGLTEIKMD